MDLSHGSSLSQCGALACTVYCCVLSLIGLINCKPSPSRAEPSFLKWPKARLGSARVFGLEIHPYLLLSPLCSASFRSSKFSFLGEGENVSIEERERIWIREIKGEIHFVPGTETDLPWDSSFSRESYYLLQDVKHGGKNMWSKKRECCGNV